MNEMNIIRVPRALDGLEPLTLDMTEIRQADGRRQEVAMVNALRAPELLTLFNNAWLVTAKYLNYLEYELDVAVRRLAETKAVILLDKVPVILAEKGLASARSPLGSEDIRQAILDRDPDYKKVQEYISSVRCYVGLLEAYQTSFMNAYNSVKKILGTDTSSWRPNPNLPQPISPSTPLTVGDPVVDPMKVTCNDDDFFGKPT